MVIAEALCERKCEPGAGRIPHEGDVVRCSGGQQLLVKNPQKGEDFIALRLRRKRIVRHDHAGPGTLHQLLDQQPVLRGDVVDIGAAVKEYDDLVGWALFWTDPPDRPAVYLGRFNMAMRSQGFGDWGRFLLEGTPCQISLDQ